MRLRATLICPLPCPLLSAVSLDGLSASMARGFLPYRCNAKPVPVSDHDHCRSETSAVESWDKLSPRRIRQFVAGPRHAGKRTCVPPTSSCGVLVHASAGAMRLVIFGAICVVSNGGGVARRTKGSEWREFQSGSRSGPGNPRRDLAGLYPFAGWENPTRANSVKSSAPGT
jgi:hypothetical protein